MKFEIGNIWIDPPGTQISNLPAAYTNIDGEVKITLGGRTFFDATLCVVELAGAIQRWLDTEPPRPAEFRFESSDEEEPNILSLQMSDDGVRINSAWRKFNPDQMLPTQAVSTALRDYVRQVTDRCRDDLGVDVSNWIGVTK